FLNSKCSGDLRDAFTENKGNSRFKLTNCEGSANPRANPHFSPELKHKSPGPVNGSPQECGLGTLESVRHNASRTDYLSRRGARTHACRVETHLDAWLVR